MTAVAGCYGVFQAGHQAMYRGGTVYFHPHPQQCLAQSSRRQKVAIPIVDPMVCGGYQHSVAFGNIQVSVMLVSIYHVSTFEVKVKEKMKQCCCYIILLCSIAGCMLYVHQS